MDNAVHQLQALREEILATIPDPWLFPAQGKVQGFMGVGPVMFVAERPSTGSFPSPGDRFLYDILEQYGIEDSHLTDVIKSRSKVRTPYPDMTLHRRVFDREIEIVRPKLIITFGQKVYDLLQFALAGMRISIRQVWHYSYTRRGHDKCEAFESQIKRVLQSEGLTMGSSSPSPADSAAKLHR